jgi:hypothetical protein
MNSIRRSSIKRERREETLPAKLGNDETVVAQHHEFLNSVTNMFLADSGPGMLASSNTEADQRSN